MKPECRRPLRKTASPLPPAPNKTPAAPWWDAELRALFVGELVVKRFRVPAHNQELVLEAFQEAGWPPHLDDPLPGDAEHDAKDRLHETIKRLNGRQVNRLIRFRGDGTGTGICWEAVSESPPDCPQIAP